VARFVHIKGWKDGVPLGAVTLLRFLQQRCGMTLFEAKQLVDKFADEGGLDLPLAPDTSLPPWVAALSEAKIQYDLSGDDPS